MTSTPPDLFPFLKNLDISPEWDRAAGEFLAKGGVALVLGGPDTGKSTLSRYLVYRAFAAGHPVGLIDLDLGQSHLGPPAALGMGLFPPRFPGEDALFPDGLYFIGQTSPVGAVLEVAVGCRVLADQARTAGTTLLVVNTSGLITGPAALRLKRAELELLNPSLLLALEREGELASLLDALTGGGSSLWRRLPVSARAARKSMEERRLYRQARFREYFRHAAPLSFPLSSFAWRGLPLGLGHPLDAAGLEYWQNRLGVEILQGRAGERHTVLLTAVAPPHPPLPAELGVHILSWPDLARHLVGLLDDSHRTLALGLILPSPAPALSLTVLTPLSPSQAALLRFVRLGRLRLTRQGEVLPIGHASC